MPIAAWFSRNSSNKEDIREVPIKSSKAGLPTIRDHDDSGL
jgi:hypothetical protein